MATAIAAPRPGLYREQKTRWDRFRPGQTMQDILACRKRIIAIEGPLGTGKSSAFCLYIAAHCAENPGSIWIVVRRTYKMLKDNTLHTWHDWFPEGLAGRTDGDENFHLDCEIGGRRARGEIRFRPADRNEDIDRFMGGEYAGVVLEEVTGTYREMGLPEDIMLGLDMRLRQDGINWACALCRGVLPKEQIPSDPKIEATDCPSCQGVLSCRPRYHLLLSFNPPPPGHWIADKFPLPPQETEDTAHFRIPPEENMANLPPGYYKGLARRFKENEDWAARYLAGERVPIGKATCVFDRGPIYKALGDDGWVREPIAQGILDRGEDGKIRLKALPGGPLRIWEFPKPKHEDRYSGGADTGEGLTDGNPSCAIFLSRSTGATVAEWHGNLVPRRFAKEIAMIGWWYNDAFICPEVEPSASGRTMCDALEQLGYGNIYQQRREQNIGDPIVRRYGLPMGRFNKTRLVGMGQEVIQERDLRICIRELLLELLTFVQHPDGRMAADHGTLDDRVIAWLCALEAYQREGKWVPKSLVGETPKWMYDLLARIPQGEYTDRSWMAT